MNKLNLIRWLTAFFRRKQDDEHIVEVMIYLDGRLIERKICAIANGTRFAALKCANEITGMSFGNERRRLKGRA